MSCKPCKASSEDPFLTDIQTRGKFSEDEQFKEIRELLPKDWLWPLCTCEFEGEYEPEENDYVQLYPNKVEIVINAKGFELSEIKCQVKCNRIVVIEQHDPPDNDTVDDEKSFFDIHRIYDLVEPINLDQTQCYLSSDGILMISAPLLNQN